jgi:aryl-alcohol dehydrogenase-like predicted oxidoreductase
VTATRTATWDYYDRFTESYGRTYFRRFGDGVASSLGLGTYLGEPTDDADRRYREAIANADAPREAINVATKGGFLPFEDARPDDPGRYLRETFLEPGIVDPGDVVGGRHCLDPAFLPWSLDRSLSNLGLDAVDLYYVHNPETQLAERSRTRRGCPSSRARAWDRVSSRARGRSRTTWRPDWAGRRRHSARSTSRGRRPG